MWVHMYDLNTCNPRTYFCQSYPFHHRQVFQNFSQTAVSMIHLLVAYNDQGQVSEREELWHRLLQHDKDKLFQNEKRIDAIQSNCDCELLYVQVLKILRQIRFQAKFGNQVCVGSRWYLLSPIKTSPIISVALKQAWIPCSACFPNICSVTVHATSWSGSVEFWSKIFKYYDILSLTLRPVYYSAYYITWYTIMNNRFNESHCN